MGNTYKRVREVAPFESNPSLPFPSNSSTHAEFLVVVHYMGLFDWFRGSKRATVILPTDIVVFIVGPSGSGKSRFMGIILQQSNVHVRISKSQRPGTTEVHAERCRFDGIQGDIVIVDTPSFCTYMDPDGEEVMRKWMESK